MLVVGSRVLGDSAAMADWARAQITLAIDTYTPNVLVTGDDRGVDRIAFLIATDRHIESFRYKLNAQIVDQLDEERGLWATPPVDHEELDGDLMTWRLLRSSVMVSHCNKKKQVGNTIVCLALVASWSKTSVTMHAANAAKKHGIETIICRIDNSGTIEGGA